MQQEGAKAGRFVDIANCVVRLNPKKNLPAFPPSCESGSRDEAAIPTTVALLEDAEQLLDRVVEAVDHAFLERDDGVVGDGDALGADLGAALRDVAVADALILFQILETIFGVEWVHLERRG